MTPAVGLVLALAAPSLATGLLNEIRASYSGGAASAVAAEMDSAAALNKGRMLLMANNPAEALSAFHIAMVSGLKSQSVAALNGIGIAYDLLGRGDLARRHFEMALALEPDAADIAFNLGLALINTGDDRAAIPRFQRAAGSDDARIAAAARRNLALIAARLTAPARETAASIAIGTRIDMASSGAAVLVLAPPDALASAFANAPVRLAATGSAAAAPAMMEAELARRLGDDAALTIPIYMPELPPDTPQLRAVAGSDQGPPLEQRQAAASSSAAITAPAPVQPDLEAALPALAMSLANSPGRMILAQWRYEAPAVVARQVASRWGPTTPASADFDKTAIRLAIARLQSLIRLIEVQRG